MTFIAALRHDRIDAPCVLDQADQRRELPGLGRAVPRSHPRAGRRRHPRQPLQPQTPRRPPGDPCGRRKAHLPPGLLARPQPDRARFRQAQTPAARRRRTNQGNHLAAHRNAPRPLPINRMRQLPRQLRLRCSLMSSRSSATFRHVSARRHCGATPCTVAPNAYRRNRAPVGEIPRG